jgi:hypothetical protein
MDTTKAADCSSIIKAFEKHLLSAPSEAAIIGSTLPKIAAISSTSTAAAQGLQSMISPPIPKEVLGSFGASVDGSIGIDIPSSVNLGNQTVDISNWKQWLASCIPCSARIDFRIELQLKMDLKLLEMLEQMVKQYLSILSFIVNLLNSNDIYADVCPLLFAMQDICIPDLQRILSLLAGILYRMQVKELESIDLLKLLILPIFQPIFAGLLGTLGQYKLLVTDPLNCVVASIDTQLEKIQTGSAFNLLSSTALNQAKSLKLVDSSNIDAARSAINNVRQPFATLDEASRSMQAGLGTAVVELRRFVSLGVFEVDSLLEALKSEFEAFLGLNDRDTIDFLLNQLQKLLIFRLIAFITSLVKALISGFNCDFSNPEAADETVDRFLNDFLGPNSAIVVRNDAGDIQLIINPDLTQPIKDGILTGAVDTRFPTQSPTVIAPTGNVEVDSAFDAIITQSSQPLTIKPRCVFEPSDVDSNKLAQWIKELNATGE